MADDVMHVTVQGIEEAYEIAQRLKDYYEAKLSELLDLMCSEGETYAIGFVGHFDTGETQSSIMAYRNKNKGFIVAGGSAIWLEFGTGVAYNSGNEHPLVYESSVPIYPHGSYGQGKGKNPNGWWYYDKNGKRRHTRGIAQNQFMYRTFKKLNEKFPDYVREVFNND